MIFRWSGVPHSNLNWDGFSLLLFRSHILNPKTMNRIIRCADDGGYGWLPILFTYISQRFLSNNKFSFMNIAHEREIDYIDFGLSPTVWRCAVNKVNEPATDHKMKFRTWKWRRREKIVLNVFPSIRQCQICNFVWLIRAKYASGTMENCSVGSLVLSCECYSPYTRSLS